MVCLLWVNQDFNQVKTVHSLDGYRQKNIELVRVVEEDVSPLIGEIRSEREELIACLVKQIGVGGVENQKCAFRWTCNHQESARRSDTGRAVVVGQIVALLTGLPKTSVLFLVDFKIQNQHFFSSRLVDVTS